MTPRQAVAFVRRHGVVLEAASGPAPRLTEAIAGEPLRGSWWGHPRGPEIFRLTRAVRAAEEVLVCRLLGGKITLVHRRLWPALVRTAARWPSSRLSRLTEVHAASGRHLVRRQAFPRWVPAAVAAAAARLSESGALRALGAAVAPGKEDAQLRTAIRRLRKHYGAPPPPPTRDPFELVLWENVAYLAPRARRQEAFDLLRRTVGTRPAQIAAARPAQLRRVAAHGILPDAFAAKLRACARIAIAEFDGDLAQALRAAPEQAVRHLRKFPGIGAPGAEKILLFAGMHAGLAPESNALRVLTRLGLIQRQSSYARHYAAGRLAGAALPATARALQEAHLLLQLHGQTLCKQNSPRCAACPLAPGCPAAAAG